MNLLSLLCLFTLGMAFRITTTSGIHGALRWGTGNAKKIIAWHGWLDNAATYSYLGPRLAEEGYDVVAVDHLGHGRSSHLPIGASYSYASGVSSMKRVLDSLALEDESWGKPFAHIGHSMSAGQSVLFAASFPERVNKLVLVEGFGPMIAKEEDGPMKMRNAVVTEQLVERGPVRSCAGALTMRAKMLLRERRGRLASHCCRRRGAKRKRRGSIHSTQIRFQCGSVTTAV